MTRRIWQFRLSLLLLLVPASASAREGLFLRLALGPGVAVEASRPAGARFALAAKDHAIGYGFTDRFAVQVADFGALVRRKVGTFDYVNLDGLGPGLTVCGPRNTLVSIAAGYGAVTFAHKWAEATGTHKDEGFAIGASLRREWPVARRCALGFGTQACSFRSFGDDYTFFVLSVEGSMSLYWVPR